MALKSFVLTIAILAIVSSISHASDPSPLQDFCVAVNDSMAAVFVNGKICKDPKVVNADDFFKSGLNIPGNTSNQVGSAVTAVNAVAFAGLSSQNPGVITIANAVFGSDPPINDDVLAKAFQVDKKVIDYLQSQFWWDNN
uniref:Germin-like protein subfamily 1 member 14 n=1 Tax=Nicotiana sylvestris TaxID=4096 RepID=A0A1U7X5K6_NICSY|nr:PREDICTED: germin-like protein subfamily 1 member 14 [Nicotiana sylvestris]